MHCFTYIVFDLWFSQKKIFKKQSYYFGEFALLVQFMNRTTSGIVLSEFVLSGDPLYLLVRISLVRYFPGAKIRTKRGPPVLVLEKRKMQKIKNHNINTEK